MIQLFCLARWGSEVVHSYHDHGGGFYISHQRDGREFPVDGDIIVAIDGKTVRKISDILIHLQREKAIGDEMILTVLRTGVSFDLTMILEERPR